MTFFSRSFTRAAAVIGVAAMLAAGVADARPGGGGSRGSRTFDAPAATQTAPRSAQPMQRTETPATAQRPGMPGAAPATAGRFGGFGGGLMAGLLGAGLLGMLFGGGLFGGLSGLASMFGLLLQVGLIVGLIWLAVRFFRRRSEPALAAAGPAGHARSGLGPQMPIGGGTGSVPPQGAPAYGRPGQRSDDIGIGPEDYAAFERLLVEVQTAYGRGDVATLSRSATPEMVRYFGQDLEDNRRRGLRNDVSSPKLLQGDLAEAWREGRSEYATVAMRFSIVDATVELASGRVVEGDASRPVEVTELWTFRREGRGPWVLSAIQQAN
jgi:predicted lipid-binding transport protein (Tim44 family)